jgi:hypothetical protein
VGSTRLSTWRPSSTAKLKVGVSAVVRAYVVVPLAVSMVTVEVDVGPPAAVAAVSRASRSAALEALSMI